MNVFRTGPEAAGAFVVGAQPSGAAAFVVGAQPSGAAAFVALVQDGFLGPGRGRSSRCLQLLWAQQPTSSAFIVGLHAGPAELVVEGPQADAQPLGGALAVSGLGLECLFDGTSLQGLEVQLREAIAWSPGR